MNKELSPLEQVKIIRQTINDMLDKGLSMDGDIAISLEKRLDNIEKALKRIPELERENFELMERVGFNATYKDEEEETQNKLKALEIIKEKPITLYLIKTCDNYDDYLNYALEAAFIEDCYTKDEYDLLKEVLL